ncbi:kinesin light chain 3 [Pochonia chlamydosporia 170]|uniref:Kinesin light chain 3 n=1 Tax=Pochonia chlamydosporia 170 TaxID=1380566 RepID=A0A219AQI3_METCM|nr:kinesin light chain 3 [Pochonia chlamydosporia 170]OWT42405.1 kinesin light chain 3 [Pochonia chlamydosporia 170]
MTAPRPSCREDFEIAIICALPLEYNAVALLFDERWDEYGDTFGKAHRDPNTYTTGRMGKHNVVLALLSGMGKAKVAAAAASMRSSYGDLELVLLVGICGGVPHHGQGEILLGDVVISKRVVQYDFGRKYPDKFLRKDTIEDNLSKHDKNIRNFLALFDTDNGKETVQERTAHFLSQLQAKAEKHQAKYQYPGTAEDKLFESSYRHKHRISPACICSDCHGRMDPICDDALSALCDDLGCDERYLEPRDRLQARRQLEQEKKDSAQEPVVHIGAIASGDTVMRSGEDRDRIAKREGVIAFEMECAGVWEEMPCIVVKAVCDYADCHKNKKWQDFAAATAASASKAILERYIQTDRRRGRVVDEPLPGHFLVPFGRNQTFVGRETILSKLLERIWPGTNQDDCQRTAVEGLGGVGKTQIALEAVYRVRNEHPDCSIFWVPVVDANTFENAYRDIGKRMKIQGIDEDKADVKWLVKTALSDDSSGCWLLVVDNADDITLLFGVTRLSDYLPFSRKGSILFTTRNHMTVVKLDIPKSGVLTLAEMSRTEATELLQTNLTTNQTSDIESNMELLDFLTDLPLAIKQASAYMAETGITTARYLHHYRSSDKNMIRLLSRDFKDQGRYQTMRNPVATTWLISFEHISRDKPLAARYLKFLCFLGEKDIPTSLLPPPESELDMDEAIGTLRAYAFITQREGQDSIDMHRLVRLAMQNWLGNEELKSCVTSAVQRLNQAFPFPEHENRDMWMRYLPHAQAALEFREHPKGGKVDASLLHSVAESYFLLGQYQKAEQMHRQSLQVYEKVLGKDHPDTLDSMNNLALALRHLGKYKEAEQMHLQTLELQEKVLGKDHPDTLGSMNNLAYVLNSLGKYEEAVQMYRGTLELRQKVLGKDHPRTLHSMNNLALALRSLGKYEEAEQMHRQTLELREKVLGKDHPDTLDSMNALAIVLDRLGKYEEAEQSQTMALNGYERLLGKDHPRTLDSMNNLAIVHEHLGKYEEAEQMYRQTLEIKEKVLGKDHPRTLQGMDNLALALRFLGKYEEAEQMHRQTVELRQKVLGKDHPDTLDSMDNLAIVLDNLGKYEEAEQMHRQTLELKEKVLGKDHPFTLGSRNNLAIVLDNLGKYEEAEQMHRQTLELREEVLGKDHPDTLGSINNLADVLDNLGKYEEAEQMHRQTLELHEKLLGKEHPSTLSSLGNLADVLDSLGKCEEAEQMHRQTLELQEKVLGKDHPDTLDSMNNLALALRHLGKYEEAEQMHQQTLQLQENVLGKDHPDTLSSMNNLANVLESLGKYEEAEKMHRQTLELRQKVLGKDHPDTLGSMNNLANALSNLGKYEEAEQMHRQTLELEEKVLGKDHPSTRRSRRNFENCLRAKTYF